MTIQKLDFIFPFVVFFYGAMMVFVLENKFMQEIGQQKLSHLYAQMNQHRGLAWICFFVGGLWSVQNIWYQNWGQF